MRATGALLLWAAIYPLAASAAVRRETQHRPDPRGLSMLPNGTIATIQTSTDTSRGSTSAPSTESDQQSAASSSKSGTRRSSSTRPSALTQTQPTAARPFDPNEPGRSSTRLSGQATSAPSSIPASAGESQPPPTTQPRYNTTQSCLTHQNQTGCVVQPPWTSVRSTTTTTCIPLSDGDGQTVTEYSVVYTSTVTFMGNRSDYNNPFETLSTPNYCDPTRGLAPSSTRKPAFSLTKSASQDMGGSTETLEYSHPSTHTSEPEPPLPPPYQSQSPGPDKSKSKGDGDDGGGTPTLIMSSERPTITFITTPKGPSVTYPNDPPPDYSQTWDHGGAGGGNHEPPGGPYVITAIGGQVIINRNTYGGFTPGQTATVTVGHGTFTILPTAVVGEGASVPRPTPTATSKGPEPTTTQLGGVQVVVSGSVAVIDGNTITIPPEGTTAMVHGAKATLEPGSIDIGGDILSVHAEAPSETSTLVVGGDKLTAVGSTIFVLHSTTLTYGSGVPETTVTDDDDTISIGPSGIVVHGSTFGGPSADATEKTFETVGGATITQILPSLVVIEGSTFTIKSGMDPKTTKVGGETITIDEAGIIVNSTTYGLGVDSSYATTIVPSGTWADDLPVETAAEDDEDAGSILVPSAQRALVGLYTAIGVWVLL